MSELTKCNYCTLKWMREQAAKRGATVILEKDTEYGITWTAARYSDRARPNAHFLSLPKKCEC